MKTVYENLKPHQRKVVNRICRGGVNFLSGTVSPAKSDVDTMDIESLAHAMEHYAKRDVKKVIVQPKYMGSRGQVYINKDLDKCYAVSRNGFKINHVDLSEVFKLRHDFWFGKGKNSNIEIVIEDGEILPWRALGDKLIDESFVRYSNLVKRENYLLTSLGFEDKCLETIKKFQGDEKRESDLDKLSQIIDLEKQSEQIKLFDHQIDLFGKEDDVSFEPFNILKIVYTNGKEDVLVDNNEENFKKISSSNYIVVDPNEWGESEALSFFMDNIRYLELEGVMVKPCVFVDQSERENRYAPMIKVRNPEYLRIVYGQDYTDPEKLEKLVTKKSIGRKVGASLKEYYIGKKLLNIPVGMLQYNNDDYKELVAEAIISNENNQELDPRL